MASLRHFDLVDPNEIVSWAEQFVTSDKAPLSLVAMASLYKPVDSEELDRLLAELVILVSGAPLDDYRAAVAIAKRIAREITEGSIDPADGARRIWADLPWRLTGLYEQLAPFVGLASEWDDDPVHRADYERDIVELARRFLAD